MQQPQSTTTRDARQDPPAPRPSDESGWDLRSELRDNLRNDTEALEVLRDAITAADVDTLAWVLPELGLPASSEVIVKCFPVLEDLRPQIGKLLEGVLARRAERVVHASRRQAARAARAERVVGYVIIDRVNRDAVRLVSSLKSARLRLQRLTAAARPMPRRTAHRAQARAPRASRSAGASASGSLGDDGGDGPGDPPPSRVAPPPDPLRPFTRKYLRKYLKRFRRKTPRPARVELISTFDPTRLPLDYALTLYLLAATMLEGRWLLSEQEGLLQRIADAFSLDLRLVALHVAWTKKELVRAHGQRGARAAAATMDPGRIPQEPAPTPPEEPAP